MLYDQLLVGERGSTFFFPAESKRRPLTLSDGETNLLLVTVPKTVAIPDSPCQVHDALGRLLTVGNWMKLHTDSEDQADADRLEHLFTAFLDEYQRLAAAVSDEAPVLTRAKALMMSSMQTGNLNYVVKALGISHGTLNRYLGRGSAVLRRLGSSKYEQSMPIVCFPMAIFRCRKSQRQ